MPTSILNVFNAVSGGKLFHFSEDEWRAPGASEYTLRSTWFNPHSHNTLTAWIVSHFEARIYLAFKMKRMEYLSLKNPLTDRDIYVDMWTKMTEAEGDELIRRTLEKVYNFNEFCFSENRNEDDLKNRDEMLRKLPKEDLVLKHILLFNQINVADKIEFKKAIFQAIKQKQKTHSSTNFLKMCICTNLKDAKDPETFFMNLVFEILEQIKFKREIEIEAFESEDEKKKKKKPKNKKKNSAEIKTGNAAGSSVSFPKKATDRPSAMMEVFSKPPMQVVKTDEFRIVTVEPKKPVEVQLIQPQPVPKPVTTPVPVPVQGIKCAQALEIEKKEIPEPLPQDKKFPEPQADLAPFPEPPVGQAAQKKSKKTKKRKNPIFEPLETDFKLEFPTIQSDKTRTESAPTKPDAGLHSNPRIQELTQHMQDSPHLQSLTRPLLEEFAEVAAKLNDGLSRNLEELPKLEPELRVTFPLSKQIEDPIPRNASRKGSLSVDLLQATRLQDEGLAEAQPPAWAKDVTALNNPKLIKAKNENQSKDSFELDNDTQKSQISSPKDEAADLPPKKSDLEQISHQSYKYSVSETQSQLEGQSLISHSESVVKKNKKGPKLVKVPRESGSKKTAAPHPPVQHSSHVHALSTTRQPHPFPLEKGSFREHSKHSESVSSTAANRGPKPINLEKDMKNAKETVEPKLSKKTSGLQKTPTLQKGANIKPKKADPPKKTPIASTRWTDNDEPVQLIPKKVSENDLALKKNLSAIAAYAPSGATGINPKNSSQSTNENNDSERGEARPGKQTFDKEEAKNARATADCLQDRPMLQALKSQSTVKVNKFFNQNPQKVIDYRPPSFVPVIKPMVQNSYSLSDALHRDLVAAIQASTFSSCKNKQFYLNDEGLPSQTAWIINQTLARVTKQLDHDIQQLFGHLTKFNERMAEPRKQTFERVNDIIMKSFHNQVKLKPYGSFETGLLTPFSDVDFAISGVEIYDNDQANEILRLVRDNLNICGFVTSNNLIENAAVPVLKFESDTSRPYNSFPQSRESINVKVDLIVDITDRHNSFNTAIRTTEYITACQKWYKSFFNNVLVLKYIANCHKLTNTYTGGVTRRTQLAGAGHAVQRIFGDQFFGRVRAFGGNDARVY